MTTCAQNTVMAAVNLLPVAIHEVAIQLAAETGGLAATPTSQGYGARHTERYPDAHAPRPPGSRILTCPWAHLKLPEPPTNRDRNGPSNS